MVSLSTQQDIIKKYETLKKSIFSKIIAKDNSCQTILTDLYREQVDSMLKCITLFESEIEGDMSKNNFLSGVEPIIEDLNSKVEKADKKLKAERSEKFDKKAESVKILLSNELSAFKYTSKELENKLENMGLMIEVHHKMHEIIIEASDKEAKRSKKEAQYNKKVE